MLESHTFEPGEEFHIIIKDPSVLTPDVRNALRPYFDDRAGDPTKNFTFQGPEKTSDKINRKLQKFKDAL